jgi:uncharacterized protein
MAPDLVARLSLEVDPALSEILATSTMTLATMDPKRGPHAAPIFFAADDRLRLYFLSDPSSRHAREIAEEPRASAGIYPEEGDWRLLRGIQVDGVARVVEDDPARDACWQNYVAKFPIVAELPEAVERSRLYVLEPAWLRLIDNRRGFGFHAEWQVEPEADP